MNPHVFLALASCLVGLGGCLATNSQDANEPSFTLKEVGPKVWAAISNPKSSAPASANTGYVIGDDGDAVIDASMSVDANGDLRTETARQVLAAIRKITTLPVRFVINTHYHLDHVGGNAVFVDAGAVVVAHRNVRGWIHSEHLRLLNKDTKPQIRAFMEALLPPTVTYDQSVDLHLGSRTIRVQSFSGHTGGDSVVLIPAMPRSCLPATCSGATWCPPWSMRRRSLGSTHSTRLRRTSPVRPSCPVTARWGMQRTLLRSASIW